MRRCFTIILIGIIIFITPNIGHAAPPISAHNAVVMDQSTGQVLYRKDANVKRPIASITKIMTAIIAIESGKLDDMVEVSRRAAYTHGSSIYLKPGDEVSLRDLVYGLMLRSGNDAAVAIAEYVGGSVGGFRYLMNQKAHWLGMTNTHFDNPHGLDATTHYSTALDMAILMRYAMTNSTFRDVTGTKVYHSPDSNYVWRNKNKLLTMYYDYCTGGKTGYTRIAGRTLVSTAKKDGRQMIVVTLNDRDDWKDHMHLYEWAFQKQKKSLSNAKIKDKHLQVMITSAFKYMVGIDVQW